VDDLPASSVMRPEARSGQEQSALVALLTSVAIGAGLLGSLGAVFQYLQGFAFDAVTRACASLVVVSVVTIVSVSNGRWIGGIEATAIGAIGGLAGITILVHGGGDWYAALVFPAVVALLSGTLAVLGLRWIMSRPQEFGGEDVFGLLAGGGLIAGIWLLA
jgi:hypothetical protein